MIKFPKRNTTTILAVLSVSVALQFFLPSADIKNTSQTFPVPEDKFSKEPGWYEQYYLMKKDENGKIPTGLYKIWNEQSQKQSLSKDETEVLTDISNIGPTNVGGRTRALVIDKSNSSHILAGAISGGLWESYDRGTSWKLIDDHSPNLNISCITQNKLDPNVYYYGTGEGTGNSSAASGEGIFKTIDGGKTFTQLPATLIPQFAYIWDIEHSHTDSHTFYVATKSGGLYRSQDAGETFERVFSTSTPIYDVEVFENGKVMFTMAGAGIFRSDNGNTGSFFKVTSGLPATGFSRVELAYCDSFPNVIYAAFSNPTGSAIVGLYRSSDSGSTWVTRGTPSNMTAINFSYAWYCFTLYVKPDNPDAVISGSVTVGSSTDGGLSWKKVKESHADNHIIIPDPADAEKYLIGNDGGIYSYNWSSHATNFLDLNKGYISTQFYTGAYFPTGLNIIGGTQDNGTHLTTNGQAVFKKLFGGDGSFTQINQQNPNIGYVSTQNGMIRKSYNIQSSSPTFSSVTRNMTNASGEISDGAWFINPFEINLFNGEELYFVTKKRIYRTTDGANSWTPLINALSLSYSPYAVGISNDVNPTVYIGGSNAMFRRIDNASTATAGSEVDLRTSVPANVKSSFISNIKVHPDDPSVVYVGFSNYSAAPRIFKVTNANTATPVWTSLNGNLPSMLPVNWIEADPHNPDSVLFAATDFGLYYTQNGGRTWIKEMAIPNVVIDMIKLRPTDGMLFIFTHGRGVWKSQILQPSGPTGIAKHDKKSNEKSKFSVYPNPAQDYINLNLGNVDKNAEQYTAKVYNLEGKLMMNYELNVSGNPVIDVKKLPAGAYIIQLNTGNKLLTSRLLKN